MLDISFNIAALKAAITILILLVAIYNFIREKIPPDLTSLLALLGLLVTGVLTPSEAFSGFSHPATISVAAVLVLSAAIERTGVLTIVARRVLEPIAKSEFMLTIVIMLLIGGLSAFINNTAAVAIFIPVALDVCRRTGASPGRVLMPMSHAATIGGMCTLVGTSTNLVAHEFALSKGLSGFSMFEFGKVGLPMIIAAYAYMLFIGRRFLPSNKHGEPVTPMNAGSYLAELLLQPDSPWIGREISAANVERDHDVELTDVIRQGKALNLNQSDLRFTSGDSLRVRGLLEKVLALSTQAGLELHRPTQNRSSIKSNQPNQAEESDRSTNNNDSKLLLAETVVLTTSGLIGQTLKSARFAERFNTVALALKRRGDLQGRPSTMPLHAGDVLVVEGTADAIKALAETQGFLVIGTPAHAEQRTSKLILTLVTLLAVIVVVSFGLAPIVTAATAGCAVLMLTGCLRPREAYQAIDLSLVFLLAGSLALGLALEKTGMTELLAKGLAGLSGYTGPYLVLFGFFIVSVIISELMSNSGTVALLGPMALSVAAQMGINPMTLLVAVAFGSSAAFAMPIGYQTSLMIYGPGGYNFKDFIRMGIALDLILAALALWLIPHFWPLIK